MSNLDHIILFLFLFIFIPFWGKYNCNKKGGEFWISAILPILLASIIIGCRHWGADYLWYKYQFRHLDNIEVIEEQRSQPVFWGLNLLLKFLNFNYIEAYITYSLIYFIGVFHLFQSYGKEAKYMYCFLILAYIGFGTSIIRQGISIGVIMFSIPFLDQKKYGIFGICAVLAFLIHSSTLLLITTIFLFKKMAIKAINPTYSILIYLLIVYVYNPTNIGFVANIVQVFSFISPKFQGYIDSSDTWFSAEASQDIYTQSPLALLLDTFFVISFFYLGYLALKIKYNKHIAYIYNIVVIGYIMLRMFFNFELLRRISTPMTMFYPIPLGYSVYILLPLFKYKFIAQSLKKKICFSFFLIILYLVLYWGRFLLQSPEYRFIWNINQ